MTLRRPTLRIDLRLLLAVAFVVLATHARAMADTPMECAEAYEKAQVDRKTGHFADAIGNLTRCADQTCPGFIRKDCAQWSAEVEKVQPSVVFSVRENEMDLTDVEVSCDGKVLVSSLDGKAVKLDPGTHRFSFRASGFTESEKQIIVHEGERNRIVAIDIERNLSSKVPEAPPPPSIAVPRHAVEASHEPRRPLLLAYSLTGAGVLAMSGFVALGAWGYSQKRDLERSCSPFCQPSEVDQVRTKYILADACLATGVLSLGIATYLFLREPSPGNKTFQGGVSAAIAPTLSGNGGAVAITGRF